MRTEGDTATGQLIKGLRRQDKGRLPSCLLIRNRLLEIEPDNIARIGTIRDHVTMPHCRAARPNRPLAATIKTAPTEFWRSPNASAVFSLISSASSIAPADQWPAATDHAVHDRGAANLVALRAGGVHIDKFWIPR